MKLGAIIAVVLAAAGIGLSIYAFVVNANPYVSAKDAAERPGVPVHVAGKIIHQTVRNDLRAGVLHFEIEDDVGDLLPVVFHGPKPGNFDSAPTASVSGVYKDGAFHADAIQTQCPSKYESDEAGY